MVEKSQRNVTKMVDNLVKAKAAVQPKVVVPPAPMKSQASKETKKLPAIKVKDEELVSHKKIVKAQKHAEIVKNVTSSVPIVSAPPVNKAQ